MDELFLKLSPNVRMRLTVAEEMNLDPEEQVFNDDLYQKYLTMHRQALARQDSAIRNIAIADAGLALLLFGKAITIPGTTFNLQDIPAAIQVLTALGSLSFLTFSQSFLNAQLYFAVVEQFGIRRAKRKRIDPDFIIAADSLIELYLKAFRTPMNVWGGDFLRPTKGFMRFYRTLTALIAATWSCLLLLHLAVIYLGLKASFSWSLLPLLFCSFVFLAHVVGILMNILPSFNFKVEPDARKDPQKQEEPPLRAGGEAP